jgi:hypothetical protein
MSKCGISFAADRMLGRLARMLRLLGYDTYYAPLMTPAQLLEIARSEQRLILTRGDTQKRFPSIERILSVKSEYPPQQLREVVEKFDLDTHTGLWTRCTLCNALIEKVDKSTVAARVEAKVFQLYEAFYRCTGCGHIYWHGSHVERILKNLSAILKERSENKQE